MPCRGNAEKPGGGTGGGPISRSLPEPRRGARLDSPGDAKHTSRVPPPREPANDGEMALQWMQEYLPRLRAFVRSRLPADLRRRESDSDVVQSVCRELIAHGAAFVDRGETGFRGYLFTTATNKVREKLRFHRQQRRDLRRDEPVSSAGAAAEAAAPTPPSTAIANEHLARLEQAIDRLPAGDREVVTLVRLAGMPVEAVAARIGKSEAATRKQLGRALIRLSALLTAAEGSDR